MPEDFKFADDLKREPARPLPQKSDASSAGLRPNPSPLPRAEEAAPAPIYDDNERKDRSGMFVRAGVVAVMMGLGGWALASAMNDPAPPLGARAAQEDILTAPIAAPSAGEATPAPTESTPPAPIPQAQQAAPEPATQERATPTPRRAARPAQAQPAPREEIPPPEVIVAPEATLDAAPAPSIESTPVPLAPPPPIADTPNISGQ